MNGDLGQLEKLQGLLETIQRNAGVLAAQRASGAAPAVAAPRADTASADTASAETAEVDDFEVEVEVSDEVLLSSPPEAPASLPPTPSAASEFLVEPTEPSYVPGAAAFGSGAPSYAPSAPSYAPSEPPAYSEPAEFEVSRPAPEDVEADFRQSVPPALDEIEAPPISTEQHRGEEIDDMEGLGVSLGFSPSKAPPAEDEEDIGGDSAPRTPPPESGPQVSVPPKDSEQELLAVQPAPAVPTIEQVGSTIDFGVESESPQAFELQDQTPSSAPHAQDDYEAELPAIEFAGGYDSRLSAPPSAREELEAIDRAARERSERLSGAPAVRVSVPPAPAGTVAPMHEVVNRPPVVISAPAALYEATAPHRVSQSFLDRLDASLALGPSNE